MPSASFVPKRARCAECGRRFLTKAPLQRTCSPACADARRRFKNQRSREQRAARVIKPTGWRHPYLVETEAVEAGQRTLAELRRDYGRAFAAMVAWAIRERHRAQERVA